MTDVSLPRGGYANNRSPSAFAAAVLLNGGVFAALIAIPAAEIIRIVDPPIQLIDIRAQPDPAPVPPPPKADPKPTQHVLSLAQPRETTIVPPIVNTGAGFLSEGVEPLGPIDTGPGLLPVTPPPPSVFIKASPNPRYAGSFKPDYPPALRREGIEGSATVRVTIDERGRVTSVALVKATDPRFFEATQEQALRYWRFEPARRDGVAVVSEQTMTVQFRLEEDRG